MLPYINVLEYTIPTYGIMYVLAATLSILLTVLSAKKVNLNREDAFNLCLYAVIGGLVGSKVLYIITCIPSLIHVKLGELPHVLYLLLSSGGFVFYGGLIVAALFCYIYIKKYSLSFSGYADLLAPFIALAHAIGRIGCFLAGCCYGIESHLGIAFSHSPIAPNNISLLPIQLIEAGCNIILCIALLIYSRKSKFSGSVFSIYLISYSIIRFVLEFFRGDLVRGVFWGISTSGAISVLLFIVGIILFRKSKTKVGVINGKA